MTQSVTTSLTSTLPKDCTPVMLFAVHSQPLDVVEEGGEQQWEVADWEVDAALGLGPWNWKIKPLR